MVTEFSESSESLPGVLEVSGLEFRYSAHGSLVLRGVDLSVGAGERVAVMGPSGSGKSTLLLCAAGLLRAGAGRVLLDGVDVVSASERMLTAMRRDRVAFIFQDLNLVESLTAAQNVALPGLMGGRMRSPGDVTGVLERVGLAGLEDRLPSRLSGGQRQRVAVARALVSRPAMVFADEPTGALDTRSAAFVLAELRRLADEGAAVVLVTHDPGAAALADSVLVMRDGAIIDRRRGAAPDELLAAMNRMGEAA